MIYLTWPTILAFAATCFAIEITPGPNMTYLAVLGVSHGRRAGLAAVTGVALGLLVIGIAAALGLAAVISNSPTLYEVLRWAGVIYLLWLAWEGWDEAGDASVEEVDPVAMYGPLFWRGLITNLLNPKAALFLHRGFADFRRAVSARSRTDDRIVVDLRADRDSHSRLDRYVGRWFAPADR